MRDWKFWSKLKKRKQRTYAQRKVVPFMEVAVPEGWIVWDLSQEPLFCLWRCQIISLDDLLNKVPKPRGYWVEEKDTLWDALRDCVQKLHDYEHQQAVMDNLIEEIG